jgi:hypothetical protein
VTRRGLSGQPSKSQHTKPIAAGPQPIFRLAGAVTPQYVHGEPRQRDQAARALGFRCLEGKIAAIRFLEGLCNRGGCTVEIDIGPAQP